MWPESNKTDTNYEELKERVSQLESKLSKLIEASDSPAEMLLDVPNACRYLGMSRMSLYRLMEEGKIRFTTVGRQRRFLVSDMKKYIDKNYVEPKPSIL